MCSCSCGGAVVQTPSVPLTEDVGIGPGQEFTPLLELQVLVLKGPFLQIDFTFSADIFVQLPGLVGGVFFRLLLDDEPVSVGCGESAHSGDFSEEHSGGFTRRIEDVQPGLHTLTIEWRTQEDTFAGIQAASFPYNDHATLRVMECVR